MSIIKLNFELFIKNQLYFNKFLVFGDIDIEINNCNTIIRNELRK